MDGFFYQEFLNQEFKRRRDKNPRYSLRGFARSLSLDAATLSQILSGKRLPSRQICEKILTKLSPSSADRIKFLDSVATAHQSRAFSKLPSSYEQVLGLLPPAHRLTDAKYNAIADWYHYAILEAVNLDTFRPDPAWIAEQFGISKDAASKAVARLFSLGLLELQGDSWVKTHTRLSFFKEDSPAKASRKRQKQILKKAITSVERDSPDSRCHITFTLAMDPTKLPEAKKRIESFLRDLANYLESGRRKQVCELSLALFPLNTQKKSK